MQFRRFAAAVAAALVSGTVVAACSSGGSASSGGTAGGGSAAAKPTIVVAAPECAHCLAMALLSKEMPGYNVKFQSFSTLTALTAGLASGAIDVGQIDYTGLVSFIDKDLPVVAISGEVNGGSDFVLAPSDKLPADDWTAFKALVAKDKAAGNPLKIASQFGTVQDIELRLELPKYGIDPDTDVDMVNVPYQGMAQALHNGSVQAAIPVQPFAAAITNGGFGVHFAYPYDQAAGDLTNVVVVSKSFLAQHPSEVAAIAKGMTDLVPYLKTPAGQAAWAAAIEQYTGTSAADVKTAMAQLTPAIDMPFTQIEAISSAMFAQKLITTDLSKSTLLQHVDYAPLATASGVSQDAVGATGS
jgi:ABC-type nitrate/sulfonate/bicarbonate transport system substrate-binding protein